jgi:hypothetical protein
MRWPITHPEKTMNAPHFSAKRLRQQTATVD